MVRFESRSGSNALLGVPGGQLSQEGFAPGPAASGSLRAQDFQFWARSRTARTAPLASLSASILGGLGKPGQAGGRLEPHTGFEFPAEYCFLRKKDCPSLAGLG
jgi:hypothetical protein